MRNDAGREVDRNTAGDRQHGPSHALLDAATWSGQFGFWEWDIPRERVEWLNDWCATLDIDPCPSEGHEHYWNQRRHPDDRACVEAAWQNHRSGATEWFEAEYRVLTRSGQWRWIGERGRIMARGPDGEPVRMVGACFDIHQRRVAEAGLKRRQQAFQTICERVPAWLVITDADGRIEFVNRPVGSVSVTAALGQRLQDLLASANRRHIEQALQSVRTTGKSRTQSLVTRRNGSERHFECRLVPILADGAVTQITAVAVEVTERRELERAVVDIASHEQQRISRDLHDGLGQELFAVTLMLGSLQATCREAGPVLEGRLAELATMVRNATETSRLLARGLAPIPHGHGGMVDALRQSLDRLSLSSTLAVRCEFAAQLSRDPDAAVVDQLYRIAQEAVTNAARHSGASTLTVRLLEHDAELCLEVEDDGCGFPLDGRMAGLGIRLMQYRADVIGATLQLQSRPGRTVVRCTYPLPGE